MEDKLKEILSEMLDVPADAIHPEFGPDDAELWDSLNNLKIVTSIEDEFGIKLSMDEITQMDTYEKILTAVKKQVK